MHITGNTEIIAHIGFPTFSFKSPMIYNPYFQSADIDAVVVPMGCQADHYPAFLRAVFGLTNIRGALITMPHKVTTVGLLDEVSINVKVAGACNAVKKLADGRLVGDMFDGAGFVRGVQRKGFELSHKRVLVVGCGARSVFLPPPLRAGFKAAGVALEVVDTGAACRIYNVLLAESRKVGAALIPL